MRIALVVPGGVDRSGQYRVIPALLALIQRLSSRHVVHVIATNQEAVSGDWLLAGARIHNIGAGRTGIRAVGTLRTLHRHEPLDVIHSIWSGGCGLIAVVAGRLLGIPSLIHVAGGRAGRSSGNQLRGQAELARANSRSGRSSGDPTGDGSEPAIIKSLADLGLRGERVPLGVDLSVWPGREPVRRAVGRVPRLIHLASLNRVKDQATLLRALALLKQSGESFHMDIIGEDTLQGAVQSLAESLGLSADLRFRGFLTQAELRPLVEAADIMVMSSRHEAGPLAMLEAAAAGVPTVGTAVGHIAEWAPEASVAVPVGDAVALAGAVGQLVRNEDLRFKLAAAAHKRAIAEDADYTCRRFETLYGTLIK